MLRKAKIKDAKQIYSLIKWWAKKGAVLERSLNYIYENIRDYWVFVNRGKILGVCALHVIGWQNLGEIKSLAVEKKYHKKGIAKSLIDACLKEAKSLGIKKVFTLTFIPAFFKRKGFRKISMNKLPHKIWSDCLNCAFFPNCKEVALMVSLKKMK